MKYQKITVAGFLCVDDKVLVIRRSEKETYLTGYYELPGGKVDFGEHPKISLEREFLEESEKCFVKASEVIGGFKIHSNT